MVERTLSARLGRGNQRRRIDALRTLEHRTGGGFAYLEYRRAPGLPGQYVVQVGQRDPLVMDGPMVDAYIAGFEHGAIAMGQLIGVPDANTTAGQLFIGCIQQPVTETDPTVPLAAPVLRATGATEYNTIKAMWTAVPGATEYTLRIRNRDRQAFTWRHVDTTDQLSYLVTGLPPGMRHELQVQAAVPDGDYGPSSWSNTCQATPAGATE